MTHDHLRRAALAGLLALAACGDMSMNAANAVGDATANAASNAAAAAPAIVEASYACQPAMALAARYDNSDPATARARVTIDGTSYEMTQVPAASGAKYLSSIGRTAGRTLVWWTRGPEGTLLEGSASDPNAPETQVATCAEAPTTVQP